MTNQQLIDFIKEQRKKGLTKEVIYSELSSNGWTINDIEEAFKLLDSNLVEVSIPIKKRFSKKSKIILIIIVVLIIISFWSIVEVKNYHKFLSERNAWDKHKIELIEKIGMSIPMPGPKYQLVVIQIFYKIFPRLYPYYGMTY